MSRPAAQPVLYAGCSELLTGTWLHTWCCTRSRSQSQSRYGGRSSRPSVLRTPELSWVTEASVGY